jgi:UDP-N-acetyl-D-galactosamine dehydrogenase
VDVHDPWANAEEVHEEYGIELTRTLPKGHYDAIVIAVAHNEFKAMGAAGIRSLAKPGAVIFDVKNMLPKDAVDECL